MQMVNCAMVLGDSKVCVYSYARLLLCEKITLFIHGKYMYSTVRRIKKGNSPHKSLHV